MAANDAGDQLTWQASLFDDRPPMPDVSFANLRRIVLDEGSWVDCAPGWLAGSDGRFARLLAEGRWQQWQVVMDDREVPEPRLTAGWSTDVGSVPAPLGALAGELSHRYGVTFDRIWVNL